MTTLTVRQMSVPLRRVVLRGVIAVAVAALVMFMYGSLVDAVGVPMLVGDPFAAAAQPIGAVDFASSAAFATVLGTALALAVARWSRQPARLFRRLVLPASALSLLAPATAVDTAVATRIALGLGHLLAAAVVIPILVRALSGGRSRKRGPRG